MKQPNIELHIEELVLHGFAPGDRYAIAEAVEHELTRLLAEQGAPPSLLQSGDVARLDSGAFDVVSNAKAEGIGGQVAQAVYGGLSR